MQDFAYVVGTFLYDLCFTLFINQKLVLSEILHRVILILRILTKKLKDILYTLLWGHLLHIFVGNFLHTAVGFLLHTYVELRSLLVVGTYIHIIRGKHICLFVCLFVWQKFPSLLILRQTAESIKR